MNPSAVSPSQYMPVMRHSNTINDVEWAPLAGRSFHLIASCAKDRKVIIWRLIQVDIMTDQLYE